jgi:hypothetical protein
MSKNERSGRVKTIWKYELELIDTIQILMIPKKSKVLHVGLQNRKPCLWVEVDRSADVVSRFFKVYGTGHPIELSNLSYLGTAIDEPLNLVWHVYGEKWDVDISGYYDFSEHRVDYSILVYE